MCNTNNVFDFITHTLGSNSTAIPGPSVVEFAFLSLWVATGGVIIPFAYVWCVWSACKWLVCLL